MKEVKFEMSKEELAVWNQLLAKVDSQVTGHAYWLDKLERFIHVINMKYRGLLIGEIDYE